MKDDFSIMHMSTADKFIFIFKNEETCTNLPGMLELQRNSKKERS